MTNATKNTQDYWVFLNCKKYRIIDVADSEYVDGVLVFNGVKLEPTFKETSSSTSTLKITHD